MSVRNLASHAYRLATASKPDAGMTRPLRNRYPAIAFLVAVSVAAPQALADTPESILQELARCAGNADAEARLRCFDAAAARAKAVLAAPPAASAGAAGRSSLDSFGLPQPPPPVTRPEQFGKPMPRAEELQSITATASEFAHTLRGKALFVLDNGQVWRQLDGDSTPVLDPPASRFKVTIERGAFGSYNLTIEGRSGLVKVVRVR
jgi:hypothetical protein